MLTTSSAHRQVRTCALKSIVKCGLVVIWREKWKPEETPNTWQLSEGTSRDTAKHLTGKYRTVKETPEASRRHCGNAASRQAVTTDSRAINIHHIPCGEFHFVPSTLTLYTQHFGHSVAVNF